MNFGRAEAKRMTVLERLASCRASLAVLRGGLMHRLDPGNHDTEAVRNIETMLETVEEEQAMKVTYAKLDGITKLPNDARDSGIVAALFEKSSATHLHPCRKCAKWFMCNSDPCAGGRVLDAGRVKIGPVIVCEGCR